uniref:Transmembrane protein n=1 Tax=Panagrolaimus sp. PS1159 TaxID=55785 RepID=A0AC35GGY6_9BILA
MTDSFKIQDNDFLFYTDDFQQQQQQCEHLTLTFIESIDEFLGQMIEPTDFICESLNTEASMLVYENLTNYRNSPITGYTVCKNYDEVKLKDYCEENGIPFENVKKDLKPGESIPEEILRGLLQIQTYQKFWAALKAKYLLDKKSIRDESFIDTTKVSPLTEQVIQQYVDKDYKFPEDHILEYPYVKEWEHLKCTKDIQSLLECFEMNNIIQKTEFAQLISKPSEATQTLNEPLTFNDIYAYGFSEETGKELLLILKENEILECYQDEKNFTLPPNFSLKKFEESLKKLPEWCSKITEKIMKKKFSYVFAYHELLVFGHLTAESFNQLPNKNDKTFITNLIHLGILESSNVNLGALEENIPNGNFYHKACSFSLKNNPCQHYYRALTAAQTTIKKTFSKSQHHKDIVSNASKEQIENVLREKAAALQKYENLDIQFVPIEDVLNNLKFDALKVKPIIHTLPYLIIPSEMKWSKKTIITLGVVGSGAAIQIAAGIGLVVATLGIGAFAGKFMVAEGKVHKFYHFGNIKQMFSGLSDAIFCAKGLWHGKTDNFLRYKMTSMAISVVLCGLTEPLKYIKAIPSILSRDAVSVIRKADIFVVSGGGSLLRTILPSFGEIKKCEKTKNLISEAINYTNCDVYGRLMLIIEGIFRNTEPLEITLAELYKKVGIQNTEKIFEKECIDFGRSADSVLISMSSFIVAEVSRNCISHSTLINYSGVISKIMASQKFQQLLTNVKDKFSISMTNIHETLKRRLEESSFEFEAEERIYEKELIKKVIETMKSRLHEKYKRLVEEKITRPLNERNNMDYQNKIRKIASTPKTAIESAQKNQNSSLNFDEQLIAKFKLEYLAKLETFLNSTKNAEIFAEFILTTPKNHQIGVNSIAKLLYFYKKRKVTVNITAEDKIFSNSFPNTPGDSIILKVVQEDSGKTLIDKLYEKVPEIQFKSYENFKADLIKVIEADIEFRNR